MKLQSAPTLMLLFTLVASSCVATTTSSHTWTAPTPAYARYGHVEAVREIVQRQQGDPVGGALLGAVIGGMIGGRGSAALVGAAGGAAIGAAASQGSSETRHYEVHVVFHDGGRQVFVYPDRSPFWPGQGVVVTDRGLHPQ